jgi:hypothetical protein
MFGGQITVWKLKTRRFRVEIRIKYVPGYRYDGDDEDGETQRDLDNGKLVAFDSSVVVEFDGEEIAADHLSSSVYGADEVAEFWTAHRGPDPMDRNCEAFRAAHGHGSVICHYFPGMIKMAVSDARKALTARFEDLPYIRAA